MSEKEVEQVCSQGKTKKNATNPMFKHLAVEDPPKVQVPSNFPATLHHFLQVASKTYPEFVGWAEDGRCFFIDDARPELKEIINKFFEHGTFASLRRQMSSYGFKKSRQGKKGCGFWSHPGFLRESHDFSNVNKFRGKNAEAFERTALGGNGDLVGRVPRKLSKPEESVATSFNFPEALHKFVTEMGQSRANMVSFTPDGCAFHIQLDDPDLGEQLKANFGEEEEICSFLSTLNAHGWERLGDKRIKKAFYRRPDFHRDLSRCDFTKILRRDVGANEKTPSDEKATETNKASAGHAYDMSVQLPQVDGTESSSSDDHEGGKVSPQSKKSDADAKEAEDSLSQELHVPTAPKFKVFQTVFARDTDGVMYEAVIRRSMYGQSQHRQVQMGLVASVKEADELLSREPEPMWHYFVHYNKWNVNWDRWVSEHNVYEPTDRVRAYAERLLREHRAVRSELTKKVKGKKGFQTVEGSEFLQRWRLRMAQVDKEMSPDGDSTKPPAAAAVPTESAPGSDVPRVTKQLKKLDTWSKAAIATETKLRERKLTGKNQHSNKLALPFSLKKNLVESWEVITQCQMVLSLPAPVTVRQALDKYLESKRVACLPATAVEKTSGAVEFKATTAYIAVETNRNKSARDKGASDNEDKMAVDGDENSDFEWREMADGIALLFDEALPNRLLYREEYPQFNVLCDHPEHSLKRLSDIYGCEHLLRLFVRLPEVVADEMSEAESRPILAKVNDFVRFLHKNQETIFALPYRKLNDIELKEQSKLIKLEERKRKRRSEMSEDDTVAKKPRVVVKESE